MARYNAQESKVLPRFWGGLVGYLTYEMVSFFENIPSSLPPHKALAEFIIPDEVIIFDNLRHTVMAVVISFTDQHGSPEQAYAAAQTHLDELMAKIEMNRIPVCRETPFGHYALKPRQDDDFYRDMVGRTKEYIRDGDIIQAVVSQPFVCERVPDLISLYRAQRFINPSPYLFMFQGEGLTLVGSSPETMVRLENRVATLRPIAGTRPRGHTEQKDRQFADELLSDEKERAEHLMLVDLGRNDLGRIAETGTVQVTDLLVIERYSHVMHLVSNINCDMKSRYDAWDLLRATFPAGTLSGAPKVRAMEIIAELEKEPRGAYGGAVGYISFHGNLDMAITIRTACIEDDLLMVRAGAGIVADSDPETERQETINKAKAIQRALEMLQSN